MGEYLKLITENKKTQVTFFQDFQNETVYKPTSIAYVNLEKFNFYVHFETFEQMEQSTALSRLHFYP